MKREYNLHHHPKSEKMANLSKDKYIIDACFRHLFKNWIIFRDGTWEDHEHYIVDKSEYDSIIKRESKMEYNEIKGMLEFLGRWKIIKKLEKLKTICNDSSCKIEKESSNNWIVTIEGYSFLLKNVQMICPIINTSRIYKPTGFYYSFPCGKTEFIELTNDGVKELEKYWIGTLKAPGQN